MRLVISAALVATMAGAGPLFAQRCIGPMDNDDGVLSAGIPPIAPEDITWCDDFDSYCGVNCGDYARDFLPPADPWLGYPPSPDNLCDPDVQVLNSQDPETYVANSAWSGYFFNAPFHWPRPQLFSSTGEQAPSHNRAESGLWPSRWEGWNGNPGWMSEPYSVEYGGWNSTNKYHTFSLAAAANNSFPGSDALNGTDENPLTLRYWAYSGLEGGPATHAFYVELRFDDDHAPTDYAIAKSATDPVAYGLCDAENVTSFPVVCQSKLLPASTSAPAGCPPLSTEVHASLAFGQLAQLDRNPCDVENGRKPTLYHAAVFDGVNWQELRSNVFAGQVGGFVWPVGQAYFQMTVKTHTVELLHVAPTSLGASQVVTSTVIVPRQYLGPFNKISFGAAPGCELDVVTGECKTPGQYDVWRYAANASSLGAAGHLYFDRPALTGGIGSNSTGACCMDDGTCSIENSADCSAAGGNWRGLDSTCETDCLGACCQPKAVCTDSLISECPGNFQGIGTSCSTADICPCPTPFADFDEDGDVDMVDFGAFQACINTNSPGVLAPGCECWDVTGDGNVDDQDFVWFAGNGLPAGDPGHISGCVSGPGVPASSECGPEAN